MYSYDSYIFTRSVDDKYSVNQPEIPTTHFKGFQVTHSNSKITYISI